MRPIRRNHLGDHLSSGVSATVASGATLAFHALTNDPDTFEMLGVKTGTGDLTTTHTSTNRVLDHEDTWRELATDEPLFGGRVVSNHCRVSDDFEGASWQSHNTITSGVTDPDGGSTAFTLTAPSTNDFTRQPIYPTSDSVGKKVLNSIWIRRRTGTGAVHMYDGNNSSGKVNITANLTTSWQRISVPSGTHGGAADSVIGVFIAAAGDEVDVWRPQCEFVDGQTDTETPAEYVENTTISASVFPTKYYANLNGNTLASNVVTEAAGDPLPAIPYLNYVPAATNSQIYSNDLTNAEWTASNMTVAQDETGIDGVASTACTLTATAANATVIANVITQASDDQATCWYIKRKTGTGDVDITLDNGSTWNTVSLTASYAKFTVDQAALTDPQIGIRLVTDTDAVIVGNAECYLTKNEAEARGLPPIFTVAAAVSIDQTYYLFDSANHGLDSAYYIEILPSYNGSASTQKGYFGITNSSSQIVMDYRSHASGLQLANAKQGGGPCRYIPFDTPIKYGTTFHVSDALIYHTSNPVGDSIASDERAYTSYGAASAMSIPYAAGNTTEAMKLRELKRYDIISFQAGKDKLDELMA